MELKQQLGAFFDTSASEYILDELRGTVPEGKGDLAVSLAEVAIAQGLLYTFSGLGQPPRLPLTVPPTFVAATIVKYDTARTNPCRSVENLPNSNPNWQDILLFSGDASKAQLLFQAEGSRQIADRFFEVFENRLDQLFNKGQPSLQAFDVESGLVHLNATLWRLALDVALGEQNGGQPSAHFDDSINHLMRRALYSPLVQIVVDALRKQGG